MKKNDKRYLEIYLYLAVTNTKLPKTGFYLCCNATISIKDQNGVWKERFNCSKSFNNCYKYHAWGFGSESILGLPWGQGNGEALHPTSPWVVNNTISVRLELSIV